MAVFVCGKTNYIELFKMIFENIEKRGGLHVKFVDIEQAGKNLYELYDGKSDYFEVIFPKGKMVILDFQNYLGICRNLYVLFFQKNEFVDAKAFTLSYGDKMNPEIFMTKFDYTLNEFLKEN